MLKNTEIFRRATRAGLHVVQAKRQNVPTKPSDGFAHAEGAKPPGSSPTDPGGEQSVPFVDGGELLDGLEGWEEVNASQSEAMVKSDRHAGDVSIQVMQERTVQHITKKGKVSPQRDEKDLSL
jgi:hypothetical protein